MSVRIDYEQIAEDTEIKFANELKLAVDSDLNKYGHHDNEVVAIHVDKGVFYKVIVKTKVTIISAMYRDLKGEAIGTWMEIDKIKLHHLDVIKQLEKGCES